MKLLVFACLLVCAVQGNQDNLKKLMQTTFDITNDLVKQAENQAYSFKHINCGKPDDLAVVHKFHVSPDPIVIPGEITVTIDAELKEPVDSPFKVDVFISKKAFFWIPVPCINGAGSCTYDDICTWMPDFECPEGMTCKCPFKPGKYQLPPTKLQIPDFGLPTQVSGDYNMTMVGSFGGRQVFCMETISSYNVLGKQEKTEL